MAVNSSGSATIYTFPPRGHFALRAHGEELTAKANAELLPQGAEFAPAGGGWYHDEAIADARRPDFQRKN